MPTLRRVLISCGEPSGDLYASELLRHVRASEPGVEAFGLGGDRLEAQGTRLLAHVRELAVVGLLEVLGHLRALRRVRDAVLAEVDRDRPDLAVLVDYGGFNLRLAVGLARRGVPTVYYVSPQVWAWRRGRIRTIRRSVDRMLVIFPFEEAVYRSAGVDVRFVGHPLVDLVHPPADPAGFVSGVGLDPRRPVLAILPGSRRQELRRHLDVLARAARLLAAQRPELQFALAEADSLPAGPVAEAFAGLPAAVVRGRAHDVLGAADAAVVASGTATVEAALLDVPMVVVYRVAPLSYALGRPLVRVPHYAMVNLIAGRRLAPELIQGGFTPDRVAAAAGELLEDPARAAAMRSGLAEVRRRLGGPGASERAATEALDVWRARAVPATAGSTEREPAC